MNSPRENLTNTKVLLEKIGIDMSKSYIIKLAKCDTYVEFDDRIVNETLYLGLQKAFVVNLKEREDRWNNIREDFYGLLDLERIDAVKVEPGWVGCFKSHQRCLRIARQKGINSCLVIEDDCELFRKDSFIQEWNQIKDWLDNNLDKWDVYLGGCTNLKSEHVHEYLDKEIGILRLEFSTTTHFIYYNKNMFDKIIQYDVNPKKYTPLDLVVTQVAKGKIVTKVPYLAKQKSDYSNIENKLVNYDEMFKTAEKIIYDNVKQQLNGTKEKIIISPVLMGGLGNRMFQVASAYGICKKFNKELVITTSLYNAHSSNDYFKNIFRKLKREDRVIKNIFKEPDNMAMKYIDISNIDEDLRLMGYFQTEKYFSSIRQEILELFEVEPERLEYLNKKFINNTNNYFIHVRRGDYIDNNVHDIDLMDYYKKSIGLIRNIDTNAIFNVFSDDLEYCKKIEWLPKDKVVFIDEKDELDSLYLMSLCNKGGIGCNSSFSWWGGYLNKNKEKKVIYPSKWFNNQWELELGWDGCYLYNHQTKEINIKESQFSIQGQIYDVWENYCAKILESGDLSTFKKHPHIEYMTEHNNLERYAPEWLQQINDKIQKLDIDKNIVLTALRKNEKYGGSTKSITIEDFKVHANSIKYANIALELIIDWNKKGLNNVNLIEIGGGYGGFSLILNEILKGLNRDIISEYILIDLKNVINLQQKYLELNNVKCNFRFINGEDVQKLKLNDRYYLFSSYSLSEIPKEVRHFYYEKLFNNVDNGLLYWNTEHIDLLGYKLDIKNEKPSTGFYNKIVYFNEY